MPINRTAQFNEALQDDVKRLEQENARLRGLTYHGHALASKTTQVLCHLVDPSWPDEDGSFLLHPGETIGQALERHDRAQPITDQEAAAPATATGQEH